MKRVKPDLRPINSRQLPISFDLAISIAMPSPRLLVIEGNSPQTTAEHVAAGGVPASKGYSDLLRELLQGAAVDICYPGDPAAVLPEGEELEGYDGITITGSSL